MERINSLSEFEKIRASLADNAGSSGPCITVCKGTGCSASGSAPVAEAFRAELKKQGLDTKVGLRTTGCHGFCEQGPLVVVHPKGIFYRKVSAGDVPEILSETVSGEKVIERLLYVDPATGERIVHENEVPFYKKQSRLLFGNNGRIDPTKIEDYIALGGYGTLKKALFETNPEEILEAVKTSGLRGRGGGGFPTGKKWASCRKAHGDAKYIICNADEGDPGAFQDRSLLEGNPHSILEGMIIGAVAIGANEGYIYVRNEYPLAVKHIESAVREAEKAGLIGKDILGSGFSFTVTINRGGGAFVCGESSALMASVEGRLGEPRFKHAHATEKGLWDKPTVLNNVKTWATVPVVINKGAEAFSKIGTERSKGTMIFSLVGKINNTGLVEVPMGITIRQLIFDIGGGIPGGKRFKAVQTGGPSGGCIPEKLLDLAVDYDSLTEAGSMMGSGSFITMDEDTCMVDVAKYFLSFTLDESCGKCSPCREGTKHMFDILDNITKGRAVESDLEVLEDLGSMIKAASLCQLGSSAPNPILSTLRYFKDEYTAHIKDKKCPAGVCKALIKYSIDEKECTGCTLCAKKCPEKAISGETKKAHTIDQEKCIKCGVCNEVCKFNAVKVE